MYQKAHTSKRQKGAALLLVLWVIAILGAVSIGVLTNLRIETLQGYNELQRSKALIAAEGGIDMAVKMLVSDSGDLVPSGDIFPFELDGIRITVRVRSEHGKLDINFCQLDSFSSLLLYFGATPQQSTSITNQLYERRNQAKPLRHLEELMDFSPMSDELYEKIQPFITLWSGRGVPDAAYTAEPLRQALQLKTLNGVMSNPGSVVAIESYAKLKDGFEAGLRTVVMIGATGDRDQLYSVYRWKEISSIIGL